MGKEKPHTQRWSSSHAGIITKKRGKDENKVKVIEQPTKGRNPLDTGARIESAMKEKHP